MATEASIPHFRFPDAPAAPSAPHLYGSARLAFGDSKEAPEETRHVAVVLPLEPGMRAVDWDRAQLLDIRPQQLIAAPAKLPAPLPAFATDVQRFSKVARDFHRWLGRTQRMETLRYAPLRMTSKPGESEADFLERVRHALQKKRDLLADRLRRKRKARQSLTQTEADLRALPEMSEITPAAIEQMAMRPRRGGTTVDLVAVVWK